VRGAGQPASYPGSLVARVHVQRWREGTTLSITERVRVRSTSCLRHFARVCAFSPVHSNVVHRANAYASLLKDAAGVRSRESAASGRRAGAMRCAA